MANKQKLTDFSLDSTAYTAFDAVTLKSLIKSRLDKTSTFTDQNYEGSNLSSMIDIIAYSYHVLLFYLNQTANESMFTEAELYENMNRIVKSLDYKPVGMQTSTVPFSTQAPAGITQGNYTIPRYSFIDAGGTFYSFKEDVTFTKSVASAETLKDFADKNLLYEGKFLEYPQVTAIGEEFETVTMIPGDDTLIDHFSINVYVRDAATRIWSQWNQTSSLFLEGPSTAAFEARLNENKRYEIKFGNDITGKKLSLGDTVAIYYLNSTGTVGQVGPGTIDGSALLRYNTVQFVKIFSDIEDANITYATNSQCAELAFSNKYSSSDFFEGETVADIKTRAPNVFSAQHRLVTKTDYESHILQNFSNVVDHTAAVNNWDYLDGQFKYLTETLKLDSAKIDANTIYNQVLFADSCDFNNIYIYVIPKTKRDSSNIIRANYLSSAQKTAIINSIRPIKTVTTETVVIDPIYMAVDVGVYGASETAITSLKDKTKLRLIREVNSTKSFDSIKNSAHSIIKTYFTGFGLGGVIDITTLTNSLLDIDGVKEIKTVRTDTSTIADGLSLLVWNPIYPELDVKTTGSNVTVPVYQSPYLNDPTGFLNKIEVVSESTSTGLVEY